MAAHAFNPKVPDADAGRSQIQDWLGLYSQTLSQQAGPRQNNSVVF